MNARPGLAGGSAAGLVAAVMVGFALLALVLLIGGRDPRLSTSATGFEGLRHWLRAEGQDTRSFGGRYWLDADAVSLRILPLYDAQPDASRARPTTREEVLALDSERDLNWAVIRRKTDATPTLIVLPKWRLGMRLSAHAHPDFLIPDARLDRMVRLLFGDDAQLQTAERAGIAAVPLSYDGGEFTARIYAPRSLVSGNCTPVLGTQSEAFLLRCPPFADSDRSFWVLTDPDLLNTHGLSLGDNAALAAAVLGDLAAGTDAGSEAAVVIDYSDGFWTRSGLSRAPEPRTWAEFAAFFAWPYTLIWLGLAVALALALWRGAVRTAPVTPPEDAPNLSPIRAEAQLLLLSGDGGRLLSDYADRRLTTLAHRLLGPRAGLARLDTILRRRAPVSGPALLTAARSFHALPNSLPPDAVLARVREFEQLTDRVIHEFD